VVEVEVNMLARIEDGDSRIVNGVVAGGKAREDPGVEVQVAVPTVRPVRVVEVGDEAVAFHRR
jgi:hypothetical protein